MCKDLLFPKSAIISKVNQILSTNCIEEIDKNTFKQNLKKVTISNNIQIKVIIDAEEVRKLLVESNWHSSKPVYQPMEPYPVAFYKGLSPVVMPKYEYTHESIEVLHGSAKPGITIYDEEHNPKTNQSAVFNDTKPLVFIKTINKYNNHLYSGSLEQVIYIFIPEVLE